MIKIGRSTSKIEESVVKTQTTEEKSPIANSASIAMDNITLEIKEGRLSNYVGNGSTLTGETTFKAMMRVDGYLKGKIHSDEGTLVVGVDGKVEANISVGSAIINGKVNGDIVASKKVELGKTAHVVGNIQTPRLKIDDGAVFEGNCTMLKSKEVQKSTDLSSVHTVNKEQNPRN